MKIIKTEADVKALVKAWFDERGAGSYAPEQNGLGGQGIHDRIGCVPVTVTQEMVGKRIGLFVSVECKKPGRRGELNWGLSKHQSLVMMAINNAAGLSRVCDGLDDLTKLD